MACVKKDHEMDKLSSPSHREPLAFLKDGEIADTLFYRIFSGSMILYARIMHDFTVDNLECLDKNSGLLLIGEHTFHSTDIIVGAMYGQSASGRVVRGLLHRIVLVFNPWMRLIGLFPGKRDIAVELLRAGFWSACIPGGIEEIMLHASRNGREAYRLCWHSHNNSNQKRRGFAEVAVSMGPGFKVHPFFCENGEEMKWNPIFELWTFLRLDVAYGLFLRSMPRPIEWLLWQVAIFFTFMISIAFSLPIPVKVTMHFGEAVVVRKGETPEQLSQRAHDSLQALIDSKQGRRNKSYMAALSQRFRWMGSRTVEGSKRDRLKMSKSS